MYILGFFLGTMLGSFAKALADRSLKDQTFLGRSECPHCKHKLGLLDLFPIFSFLLSLGRCRYCKKPIGFEYPLVEVTTGILVAFLFFQNSLGFEVFFKAFFVTILVTLFLTDLKEMFIPDRVIIPAITIAFLALLINTIYKVVFLYQNLNDSTIGKHLLPPSNDFFARHAVITAQPLIFAVVAGLALSSFFLFLVLITKGRGMGLGDVKLGVFMGLGLGLSNGILALILSFTSGAIISIFALIFGKKKLKSQIPFGPFLVFGSLVSLFFGSEIVNWYLRFGY